MIILLGPYCFVCGGKRVIRRQEYGTVAWTNKGEIKGMVDRDMCLDCEEKLNKEMI